MKWIIPAAIMFLLTLTPHAGFAAPTNQDMVLI